MKTRVIQDGSEPAENGIDPQAPVVGTRAVEVAAAREVVWNVVAGIDEWPTWNPDVKSAALDGELAQGSVFRWKAGPGTITSTIERVERPRRIAWTGRTFGIDAIHVYALEPRGGKTFVTTEESYDGFVARRFRRQLQKRLDRALEDGLRHLKSEAERRSLHPTADGRS
jgi:hypothetical protein